MINRRTLLASSSVLALSACANRSFLGSKPTSDELLIQEFIQRETALVDIYFAGINQERSFRTQLQELRDHHLVHLLFGPKKSQLHLIHPLPDCRLRVLLNCY